MDDQAPPTYKALVCAQLGDPTQPLGTGHPLSLARRPVPPLLAGDAVRVRVAAAALNFADALMVRGQYQERPRLPFTPGSELSGRVVEVGRDVRTLAAGDAVAALCPAGGAFAEQAVVPERCCVRLPAGADVEAAAGLPIAYGTAWMALHQRAALQSGETVLVLGAGGGVGLAAVQIARLAGARVVAIARGRAKRDALKAAGADAVLDVDAPKLAAAVKAVAPHGVDVLFDPVGGALFDAAARTVAWGGRLLVIGFASGKIPTLSASPLLVKNLTVHGIYWGAHLERAPAAWRRSLDAVAAAFARGDLAVPVSHRYSLEQAPEAFSVLLRRDVVGKALLLPGPRSML